MSRAFDFTVVGVIWIVAIVLHLVAVELFAPGSPLYEIATTGTGTMNGTSRADTWHQILAVWMPLFSVGGISAWAFIREYRRQAATARQPVR